MLVCRPSKGADVAGNASTKQRNLIRTLILFALSTVVLMGFAPQASAATVGYSFFSRTLYYVAAPGEVNNVTIASTADSYYVSDPGATLKAQYGCKLIDAHSASCPSNYVRSLYVKTADLDDTISLPTLTGTIDCGLGIDTLRTPDPTTKPTGCESVNPPPATTPVIPPTVAPVTPPLSIVQPVATMTPRGHVPLTLSCSETAEGACTGTLVFSLPPKAKKSQVGASRRGAPNIVGRQRITVDKGKKRKVKVSMTGKGRGMVKRRKRLKVTAKLQVKQAGKTTTTSQTLTIRAPRGR
jgi:hypothetical protein